MDLTSFDVMPFTVDDMCAYLDQRVYGQQVAKRGLSRAVHLNLDRMRRKSRGEDIGLLPDRINVLLMGPTGNGKTHLVRTLAEAVDVPFVLTEATRYSAAGYKGSNAEDLIEQVYHECGSNAERASKALVLIDEIDKIRIRERLAGGDVGGVAVQQSFLTILGGSKVRVPGTIVDTSSITFVAAGAFQDLELAPKHLDMIDGEKVMSYGFIPEFVGRFSTRLGLTKLTPAQMADFLCNCATSPLQKWRNLLAAHRVTLHVHDDWVRAVIQAASRMGTGLRGVIEIVSQRMGPLYDVLHRLPADSEIELSADGMDVPVLLPVPAPRADFPFASGEPRALPPPAAPPVPKLPAPKPPRIEKKPEPQRPHEEPAHPDWWQDIVRSQAASEATSDQWATLRQRSKSTAKRIGDSLGEFWVQLVSTAKTHPVKIGALFLLALMCGLIVAGAFNKNGNTNNSGIEKKNERPRLFPELDYPPSR
jgi:ATP-dependent Clp protease ATP-binding subunit ClpX